MPSADSNSKRDVCAEAREAIEQRRAILGPCLAAMGFSEFGAPPPELPEPLLFCGMEVRLDSWERNVLLGSTNGDSTVLLAHFAEGIAFRALGESRLKSFDQHLSEGQEAEQSRFGMIEETAVGKALQQEVQRDIDRLVAKGEMFDAKKLTGFRRKIDQSLAELEKRIDDQAREQAVNRSVELLTPRETGQAPRKRVPPPVETGLTLEDLQALEKKLTKTVVETAVEEAPEKSTAELFEASLREQETGTFAEESLENSELCKVDPARRFRLLMLLLAVCCVAYAVFWSTHREPAPPPRLGMAHFEHINSVLSVTPRPPSLYVDVKTSKWQALPADEKTQLVEELGRIAGGQGYSGVQVKTSDGTNVGQWLRDTGARLIAIPKVAS